jgi:hypothetical protein
LAAPAGGRDYRAGHSRDRLAFAALIIGGCLLAAAGLAALLGRGQLRRPRPPSLERAVGSVKAAVEEIKESAHR